MTVIVHRAVGRPIGLAWLTTAVFALCTVVSLVSPHLGVYLLLLLVVTGRIERPATSPRPPIARDLADDRWALRISRSARRRSPDRVRLRRRGR